MKTLLVINGHPDPRTTRFCAGLASAYQEGAEAAGWQTRRLDIGACSRTTLEALKHGAADGAQAMFDEIASADRLVVVYPLMFHLPPQELRDVFCYLEEECVCASVRKAHVVVTMDMPAFAYRATLRPGGTQTSSMLDLPGIVIEEPVLIGCVSTLAPAHRQRWIAAMRDYGQQTALGSNGPRAPSTSLVSRLDRTVMRWWAAR